MKSKRWLFALAAVALGSTWLAVRSSDRGLQRSRPIRPSVPQLHGRTVPAAASLATFGSVSGMVLSEHGRVSGARVCAVPQYEDGAGPQSRRCGETDHEGRYQLSELFPGAYVISAVASAYEPGVARSGLSVFPAPDAELKDINITLRSGGSELAGVVLDLLGGPVPDARIRVDISGPPRKMFEIAADQSGRFATWIEAGRVTLVASASGYAPARAFPIAPNRDVTLLLRPAGRITGRVVYASDGAPASDIGVYTEPAAAWSDAPRVLSDVHGKFVLDGLEPGRYSVRARGAHARGKSLGAIDVALGTSVEGVEIELQPAARVSGRVMLLGDEQPCQSGAVTLGAPHPLLTKTTYTDEEERRASRSNTSAVIQPDGTIQLDGVDPGHHFVAVNCDGHDAIDGPFTLDVGTEEIRDLLWHVDASARLAIRVVDQTDRPVPSAGLFVVYPALHGETAPALGLLADKSGVAKTTLARRSGRYTIRAANNLLADPVEFELPAGQLEVTQTLRLGGSATIEINLTTAQGEPLRDLEVLALPASNDDVWESIRATELGPGEYRAGPLVAGSYRVRVQDGVNAPVFFGGSGYTARAGTSLRLQLTLNRNATLRGRVVDDTGAPVADALIAVARDGHGVPLDLLSLQGQREVLSAADGSFTIGGLAGDGEYTLRASDVFSGPVVSAAARPGTSVTVTIPRAGELAGSATDTIGNPVEEFSLEVVRGTSARMQFVSALRGAFVLRSTMSGALGLRAWDNAGRVAAAEVNLDPGGRAEVTLAFAAGELMPRPRSTSAEEPTH